MSRESAVPELRAVAWLGSPEFRTSRAWTCSAVVGEWIGLLADSLLAANDNEEAR